MMVLVCNAGSTSLKFKLYNMPNTDVLAQGAVERVGSQNDAIFRYANPAKDYSIQQERQCVPDYTSGIEMFLSYLLHKEYGVLQNIAQIERVGFKCALSLGFFGVHQLTDKVLAGMEAGLAVAPVHNSAYLAAIRQFAGLLPGAVLVGVFETAFHTSIPTHRRLYAAPYEWYEKYGLQRLGYHGASHGYVADCITEREGEARKVISCHLGGSCSLCAIQDGKSVDNSFGFSLQTGVMHANRCGDIDLYILPYLAAQGLSTEEVMDGLEKNGGLLGISGVSNDLRYIRTAAEGGNTRAQLAIDAFCHDIVRYIGSYYAELGGLTDLVFTAGIGENDAQLRRQVCSAVEHLGIVLDEEENARQSGGLRVVSAASSPVKVWVIPANEELGVARRTYEYS